MAQATPKQDKTAAAIETSNPTSPAATARSVAAKSELPLCFVISPIGSEGSDIRKNADKVLKHIIAKPLDKNYRIERADEISKPGLITVQIIQRLREAELVIADLSGGNPNVYYELAIRHNVARPIVHIIAEGQEAPFDVNQMRFVRFNISDPDSIDTAQKELLNHVEALEKGEEVVTPIQVAGILAESGSSGKGGEVGAVLNALYSAVGNLQQEMRATRDIVEEIYLDTPQDMPTLPTLTTFGTLGNQYFVKTPRRRDFWATAMSAAKSANQAGSAAEPPKKEREPGDPPPEEK